MHDPSWTFEISPSSLPKPKKQQPSSTLFPPNTILRCYHLQKLTFLKKVDLQNSLILTKRKQQFLMWKKRKEKVCYTTSKYIRDMWLKGKLHSSFSSNFPETLKYFCKHEGNSSVYLEVFFYITCKIFSGVFLLGNIKCRRKFSWWFFWIVIFY